MFEINVWPMRKIHKLAVLISLYMKLQLSQMEQNGVTLVGFVEATVSKLKVEKTNALVLGSACGLTSFLLTKTFQKVCVY